jgi:Skp family chaperone for outer membrane proteins
MQLSSRMGIGLMAAGAIAAVGLSLGARAAQDPPTPRTLRIAVVNLSECVLAARNDHAKDLSVRFDAIKRLEQEELGKLKKAVDDLKSKINTVEAGSELQKKLYTDYRLAGEKFKIQEEFGQRELIAARDAFQSELYSEARKMADVLAREMKIDLVLRSDDGAFEEEKGDASVQKNLLRAVLFHDPSLDITDKVLVRLNEDYKKKKASAEVKCPKCGVVGKEAKCQKCGETLK